MAGGRRRARGRRRRAGGGRDQPPAQPAPAAPPAEPVHCARALARYNSLPRGLLWPEGKQTKQNLRNALYVSFVLTAIRWDLDEINKCYLSLKKIFIILILITTFFITEEGPPLTIKELRTVTILREIPFVVPFSTRVLIFQGLLIR